MKAIQHFYDAIRKAFFKSEEYNFGDGTSSETEVNM